MPKSAKKKLAWDISDLVASVVFALVGIALLFASTFFNDEIHYGCLGSGILMIFLGIITIVTEYKNKLRN